jgi:hypothetical protein
MVPDSTSFFNNIPYKKNQTAEAIPIIILSNENLKLTLWLSIKLYQTSIMDSDSVTTAAFGNVYT